VCDSRCGMLGQLPGARIGLGCLGRDEPLRREQRSEATRANCSWQVNGLCQSANGAGMILDCRRLSNRLQQLTADNADEGLRLQAHHSAWATYSFAGELAGTPFGNETYMANAWNPGLARRTSASG
jgi:hypothetical protein